MNAGQNVLTMKVLKLCHKYTSTAVDTSAHSNSLKLCAMPWWASLSSRTDDIWLRVSLPYYLPDAGRIRKMGFQMALPSTPHALCHRSVKWLLLKHREKNHFWNNYDSNYHLPFLAGEIRINPGRGRERDWVLKVTWICLISYSLIWSVTPDQGWGETVIRLNRNSNSLDALTNTHQT